MSIRFPDEAAIAGLEPHLENHCARVIILRQIGTFLHWLKPFHVYRTKPLVEQGAQQVRFSSTFYLQFRRSKHLPILPSHRVLSHFQSLPMQSSPGVFFSCFYIGVDSHSSVKILLQCHFLNETITESFRNSFFLLSSLL